MTTRSMPWSSAALGVADDLGGGGWVSGGHICRERSDFYSWDLGLNLMKAMRTLGFRREGQGRSHPVSCCPLI